MKYLFTLCVAMICSVSSYAQYDLNGDGKETVADVSSVVNRVLGNKDDSITSISVYKNGELVENYNNTSTDTYTIKYNISHFVDGHEYVDLGLPSGTLWAKTNIGAETETDAGLYFAWGETIGYLSDTSDGRSFDWASYKWMINGQSSWTGCTKYTFADGETEACWYNEGVYVGTTIDGKIYTNLTKLESSDDAATVNWSSNWRMPTLTEIQELVNNTNNSWTTINNVSGYKFVNKSDATKYIFLPATGTRGEFADYWSSELDTYSSNGAWVIYFYSVDLGTGVTTGLSDNRRCGNSVRAVRSSTK